MDTCKPAFFTAALCAASVYAGMKAYEYVHDKGEFDEESLHYDLKGCKPHSWMSSSVTPEDSLIKNKDIRSRMEILCMELQAHLCRQMELLDGKAKFIADKWERPSGDGGGISCVLENGKVFEKAGINISVITSELTQKAVEQMRERLQNLKNDGKLKFSVVGISSVNHPVNPHAPTMHFNFRYFEVTNEENKTVWWFGGGCDLTPSYLYEKDAVHFHTLFKEACDKHDPTYYKSFKKWCDEYFFIKHRGESRGVGGIFFDDLDTPTQDEIFNFVQSCAAAVTPAYLPIIAKRCKTKYSDRERQWQLLRRGRYVEFNLIYDRGTKFGLLTPDARIESIFVSMPLYAKWVYCHNYEDDKRQMELMDVLKNPREWIK